MSQRISSAVVFMCMSSVQHCIVCTCPDNPLSSYAVIIKKNLQDCHCWGTSKSSQWNLVILWGMVLFLREPKNLKLLWVFWFFRELLGILRKRSTSPIVQQEVLLRNFVFFYRVVIYLFPSSCIFLSSQLLYSVITTALNQKPIITGFYSRLV